VHALRLDQLAAAMGAVGNAQQPAAAAAAALSMIPMAGHAAAVLGLDYCSTTHQLASASEVSSVHMCAFLCVHLTAGFCNRQNGLLGALACKPLAKPSEHNIWALRLNVVLCNGLLSINLFLLICTYSPLWVPRVFQFINQQADLLVDHPAMPPAASSLRPRRTALCVCGTVGPTAVSP
jgi:hypothetical protein